METRLGFEAPEAKPEFGTVGLCCHIRKGHPPPMRWLWSAECLYHLTTGEVNKGSTTHRIMEKVSKVLLRMWPELTSAALWGAREWRAYILCYQMSSHRLVIHTPDPNTHMTVLFFMFQPCISTYMESPKGGEMGVTTLPYLPHSPQAWDLHSRLMEFPIAPLEPSL